MLRKEIDKIVFKCVKVPSEISKPEALFVTDV